jgi:hypothetical protein
MFNNPIKGNISNEYGLRITLVVKNISLISTKSCDDLDKYCNILKTYCKIHNIIFTIRDYCSIVYDEDRDNICKLPACHIYKNNIYLITLYDKESINDKIQDEIAKYKKEQEKIKLKREVWNKRFNSIILFTNKIKNIVRPTSFKSSSV